MKDLFWEFLESIFNNIFKLYKTYFIHWTISRILITLFSLVAVIVFIILPVATFAYKYFWYDQILKLISSMQEFYSQIQAWQEPNVDNFYTPKLIKEIEPIAMIAWGLVGGVCMIITSFIVWYANTILVTRLNLGYIRDLPVDYEKNAYFSLPLFWKFSALQLIRFWVFVLGFMVIAVLFVIISYISRTVGGEVLLWIVSVIGVIGLIVGIIYVTIRLIFTEYVLADTNKEDFPVLEAFKQSWILTKNKALWIILISVVAWLTIWIWTMILESILWLIPYIGMPLSFLVTGYVWSMMMCTLYEEIRILHSTESQNISR